MPIPRFYDSLQRIYIINKTSSLGLVEDGIDERFLTLDECVRELDDWESHLSGGADIDPEQHEFFQVMKWLFTMD